MAIRTNIDDVRKIADLDVLSNEELTEFIIDANAIVTSRLDGYTDAGTLERVEKWLSVHLASMKHQRISRERIGPLTKEYEGTYEGWGLRGTRYGRMAIAIDDTGRLGTVSRYVKTVNEKNS